MKVWPVAPLMALPLTSHWLPLALLEVRVTLPPAQKEVAPLMVGVGGRGVTVTAIVRAALVPQPLVAVTLSVPDVAETEKSTVTEFPVPLMVAPVPE